MTWQVYIAGYLVFATASFLLRRSLAKTFQKYNQLVNLVFFLFFLYPGGLLLSLFVPHNLSIGFTNLLILLTGSLAFPIVNLAAYKASEHLDASIYSLISNLAPIFTISGALLTLDETLTWEQFIGAVLLITSAIVVVLPSIRARKLQTANYKSVLLAISGVALLGFAIVFERFMLQRIDFGAYLIIGWGAQVLWAVSIALKRGVNLKVLKNTQTARPILIYGLINTLKAICFISALRLGTASLVSASTSFVAVLVVIAAYFILREHDHPYIKFSAAVASSIGLYLL